MEARLFQKVLGIAPAIDLQTDGFDQRTQRIAELIIIVNDVYAVGHAQLHSHTHTHTHTHTRESFLRQHHLHAGPGPAAATDHTPVMEAHDVAYNRESQAAAVWTRGDKGVEDLVANRFGNADTVVQYLDRRVSRFSCQDANDHQPAGGICVLEGGDAVDDEVVQGELGRASCRDR